VQVKHFLATIGKTSGHGVVFLKPRKVRKRNLTVEKLVEAALEVLSEDDPSPLTRRSVAERCGVSAMALYHHVDNKEELEKPAVDSLFLKITGEARKCETWYEQITDFWLSMRACLLEIPGAGRVFTSRAVLGPGTALATEELFRLLEAGGIRVNAVPEAADSMTMLLIGSIANELTRPKQVREKLWDQAPNEQTPFMAKHLEYYSDRDGTQRYERALTWILDGAASEQG